MKKPSISEVDHKKRLTNKINVLLKALFILNSQDAICGRASNCKLTYKA